MRRQKPGCQKNGVLGPYRTSERYLKLVFSQSTTSWLPITVSIYYNMDVIAVLVARMAIDSVCDVWTQHRQFSLANHPTLVGATIARVP